MRWKSHFPGCWFQAAVHLRIRDLDTDEEYKQEIRRQLEGANPPVPQPSDAGTIQIGDLVMDGSADRACW